MKIAVITGASSGIGKAIALRLLALNYKVIGISRTIDNTIITDKNFIPIQTDLSNTKGVDFTRRELQKYSISILINSAGMGRFAPHEEFNSKTITEMTFLNLTAPMLLTNLLLRNLKKNSGYLININSIEALRASKFSAVYSATKTGLRAFSDSLFEETRKSELSITNINPDMTQTNFYDKLHFETSKNDDEKLFAEDIADVVEHILQMRKGAVISDYTIRALKFGISKKKLQPNI
ncbi:MAG: SDR family NAD(P)-dependent oxidoreductase [Campylobacterota bacterium]|nr:SDR family NAD(P)-dependent oxidoreductase [Campylobacterota bacterium]